MDWEDPNASKYNTSPNIVRDAMIYYEPNNSLKLGFGQITVDPKDKSKIRSIYSGYGSLTQMSYLFKNNVELAVRYANITPDKKLYLNEIFTDINEKKIEQYHLGISKYIYGHRVKVQGNLLYHITHDLKNLNSTKQIGAIFQIELGI